MKKVIINLSNKTFYTLVVIGLVVLLGVGVYAVVSPGGTGDPGHNIQDIGPPLDCDSGEVLQYDGVTETWNCTSAGGVDTNAQTICDNGQVLLGNGTCHDTSDYYEGSTTGWYVPSDVKLTTLEHGGTWSSGSNGYKLMHDWIQTHGCSGYHVCSSEEIGRYISINGVPSVLRVRNSYWVNTYDKDSDCCSRGAGTTCTGTVVYYWYHNPTANTLVFKNSGCYDGSSPVLCCK